KLVPTPHAGEYGAPASTVVRPAFAVAAKTAATVTSRATRPVRTCQRRSMLLRIRPPLPRKTVPEAHERSAARGEGQPRLQRLCFVRGRDLGEKPGEPLGLAFGEGDRGVRAQVSAELLMPDAHANLGLLLVVAEIARNTKRLAVGTAEQLRDFDPQRRGAPRAVAKRAVNLFGATAALGHEAPIGLSVARKLCFA